MTEPLYDRLSRELARHLPMHMPGHKRNAALAPYLRGLRADLDITEIEGYDNLHAPEGILLEGMERAARLWGAAASYYLVGGSTAGILAGIRALTRPGDKVILQRGSHLSVYHGVALCGLVPAYLYPPRVPGFDAWGSVAPALLHEALAAHPDARLLVLTCPGYEGILSDLPALVRMAHQAGLRVLVDAAHGAHLGLAEGFPAGAVAAGADIVVHSLHKTLPAHTQTGLAHALTPEIGAALAEQLDLFQTSSPSYLLMASIDGCLRLLAEEGEKLFAHWRQALDAFAQEAASLRRLRILRGQAAPDLIWGMDPGKIHISCAGTDITGHALMDTLRRQHGIELEAAGPDSALAMTGMGDSADTLLRLARALAAIDARLADAPPRGELPLARPQAVCPPGEALAAPFDLVPMAQAEGLVCAEYAVLYPPGAPLAVPGERLTGQVLAQIDGATLLKTRSKHAPDRIAVMR
ncbi:MAG: aminotransferase class I/II-fold pyridoxal phosphate-dependent enzyme [Clostridiales bacterium]|nr:aminotransferase class I/II-fold pyridoxal phosphate-dependent enzyme [Clostridiales bacterium]